MLENLKRDRNLSSYVVGLFPRVMASYCNRTKGHPWLKTSELMYSHVFYDAQIGITVK